MITEQIAKRELKRISGLSFFPTEPVAVKELVKALQLAETEAVAETAINEILETCTDTPKPSEIRAFVFAFGETERSKRDSVRAACTECGGSGFRQAQVRRHGTLYDMAVKCEHSEVKARQG